MPVPVLSLSEMRQWEKATWASGVCEVDVIRRAGLAVAREAEALSRPGDFVLFLAGRGNNGEDARQAHEILQGRHKEFLAITEPELAAKPLVGLLNRRPALIVDGLFGIGLNRPLSPAWSAILLQINAANRPVLSVDIPSGLDTDTGRPREVAIRATRTLTLGAAKAGVLAPTAGEFVGQLKVAADIGLVPCPFTANLVTLAAEDFEAFPPSRPVGGHKGTFGHLAIIAGSRGFHGSAVLAARAAQRAQPGLITLFVPEAIYAPVAAQLQAVMVRPYVDQPEIPSSVTAIVAGPGLAAIDLPAGVRDCVRRLWKESPLPVVADASALDWLPGGPGVEGAVRVMTPHPGEAARLLGSSAAAVQAGRVAALREMARKFHGTTVILKGHLTLVGSSEGPVAVNLTGNPHLAQGGSGDVLAGFLGGLLAQSALSTQPHFTTALHFAVWRHGLAADQLLAVRPGFVIEELPNALGCLPHAVLPMLP